mmetsp:Transcript_25161/g.65940  ORF Transcript_25161/g.65940 Transcript_25161/m.65940 type:complete len:254 (-) Transcript_25161:246-1007(-)
MFGHVDRAGHIIAPRGTEAHTITSYGSSFDPSLQDPSKTLMMPVGSRTDVSGSTHERCICHVEPAPHGIASNAEPQLGGPVDSETSYGSSCHSEQRLVRHAKKTMRSRGLSREEYEQRWRNWQQRPRGRAAQSLVESDATVMPAGQRPAKGLHQEYSNGVRVPLMGADNPIPIWSTLASAPWNEGSDVSASRCSSGRPPVPRHSPLQASQEAEWQATFSDRASSLTASRCSSLSHGRKRSTIGRSGLSTLMSL